MEIKMNSLHNNIQTFYRYELETGPLNGNQAVIKEVQRSGVTCLLTGQYDTEEYGTIAGVIQ